MAVKRSISSHQTKSVFFHMESIVSFDSFSPLNHRLSRLMSIMSYIMPMEEDEKKIDLINNLCPENAVERPKIKKETKSAYKFYLFLAWWLMMVEGTLFYCTMYILDLIGKVREADLQIAHFASKTVIIFATKSKKSGINRMWCLSVESVTIVLHIIEKYLPLFSSIAFFGLHI